MIKFVKIEMSRTKLSFSSKIRYQKYQGSFSSQNKKQQIFSLTQKNNKMTQKDERRTTHFSDEKFRRQGIKQLELFFLKAKL